MGGLLHTAVVGNWKVRRSAILQFVIYFITQSVVRRTIHAQVLTSPYQSLQHFLAVRLRQLTDGDIKLFVALFRLHENRRLIGSASWTVTVSAVYGLSDIGERRHRMRLCCALGRSVAGPADDVQDGSHHHLSPIDHPPCGVIEPLVIGD